jgi:hypothetical protein
MHLWCRQGERSCFTDVAVLYFSLVNYIINIFLAGLSEVCIDDQLLTPRLRTAVNPIPLPEK